MTTTVIGDNAGYTVGIVDSHIQQNTATTNFGTAASFNCQSAASGQISRAVMKFTGLSTISGPATVTSAVLTVRNRDAAASTRVLEMRRLLSEFNESQVTWNNRLTGVPWNIAGVKGGADVDSTVLATATLPTTAETNITFNSAALNQYVQNVINGVNVDHGILLSVIDDSTIFDGVSRRIGAKENTTLSFRPFLTVTYTIDTPPTISIDDVASNNLNGTQTFTVVLSSSFALPVNVDYSTANNTASSGVDYTSSSGTLTFAPGETSKSITIQILP